MRQEGILAQQPVPPDLQGRRKDDRIVGQAARIKGKDGTELAVVGVVPDHQDGQGRIGDARFPEFSPVSST